MEKKKQTQSFSVDETILIEEICKEVKNRLKSSSISASDQLSSQSDTEKINTIRQLADSYERGELIDRFEYSFLRNNLKELIAIGKDPVTRSEWEKHNGNYQARLKTFHENMKNRISRIKKYLPADFVMIIDKKVKRDLIYMALIDFSNAIHISEVVLPYIKKHNKKLQREKVKILCYIKKLVASQALSPPEKKYLEKIQERFSLKGKDYPLMPLDFASDLGCSIWDERFDESILEEKLTGIWHFSNITFPRNRRPDKFLLQAFLLLIYEALGGSYDTKNEYFENLTANIINAFFKKFKSGALKHLANLKSSDIYNAEYSSK